MRRRRRPDRYAWQQAIIDRWPYSYMNAEDARIQVRVDLAALGFTDDDLTWLLTQGWDPVPYLNGR